MGKYKDSLNRTIRKNLKNYKYNSGYGQATRNSDVMRIAKQYNKNSKQVNKDYLKLWKNINSN